MTEGFRFNTVKALIKSNYKVKCLYATNCWVNMSVFFINQTRRSAYAAEQQISYGEVIFIFSWKNNAVTYAVPFIRRAGLDPEELNAAGEWWLIIPESLAYGKHYILMEDWSTLRTLEWDQIYSRSADDDVRRFWARCLVSAFRDRTGVSEGFEKSSCSSGHFEMMAWLWNHNITTTTSTIIIRKGIIIIIKANIY